MDDHARYYTRGVRFPRLVGRTADGTRIPGGPYTLLQAVGGLLVFVVGQGTRPLWGGHGLLADYTFLAFATFGAAFALRFARPGGRDPVTAAVAVVGLYLQPRTGALNGRGIRIRRPHLVTGRIAVLDLHGLQAEHRALPPATTAAGHSGPTDPAPQPATEVGPGSSQASAAVHVPAPARPAAIAEPVPGPQPAVPLSHVGRLLATAVGTAAEGSTPGTVLTRPSTIEASTPEGATPEVMATSVAPAGESSIWRNTPRSTTPGPVRPRPTTASSPAPRTGPEGAPRA
jgi:hypothetical protein